MRQDKGMCKKTRAFTLIELLVVIAIIALLMAVILPALKAVKDSAKKTVCLAHMKGIGTLLLTYSQENDDELVSVVADGFGTQDRGTIYYTYYQASAHPIGKGGPSGLGWLWKTGLLESNTDLAYCPSMYNLFNTKTPTKEWNPKGDITHWNYLGRSSSGCTNTLWPKDEHIDWMPLRLTIGARMLRPHYYDAQGIPLTPSQVQDDHNPLYNFKTVAQAASKGKRTFISDLWAPQVGNYWQSRYTDIPHMSGGRRSMNFWGLDGRAGNVKMEDDWFDPADEAGNRLMSADVRWTTMVD